MIKIRALTALLLLAGCLDPSNSDGLEGDADSQANGSSGGPPAAGDPLKPGDSKAALESASAALLDLEGMECTAFGYRTDGSGRDMKPYLPPGFTGVGESTAASYIIIIHDCRSALLGGSVLQKDVRMAVAYTFAEPSNGSHDGGLNIYLLEAFTDWPILLDAWGGLGVDASLAEFQFAQDINGESTTIKTGNLEYSMTSAVPKYYPINKTTSEFTLFAGDGSIIFDYGVSYRQSDFLARPTVIRATGGILGALHPVAYVGLQEISQSTVKLVEKDYK